MDRDLLELMRARARRRGTTLTAEIEAAVAAYVAADEPNAGLKALIGIGETRRPWPDVDSDETQDDYLRSIERDAFGQAPDPEP